MHFFKCTQHRKIFQIEAMDSVKVYTTYIIFFIRKTFVEKTDASRF
jgi:hypothetical protein